MWRFPDDLADEPRLEGAVQMAIDSRKFGGPGPSGGWIPYSYEVVRALLLAGYTDACCKVAKSQKDHWVGRATLRRYMSDQVIDALAQPLSEDTPGLLHRHGDVCRCLTDHEAKWPPWVEFAVHDFLATNPSKAERTLSTLKKKEASLLRAEALRKWWYACAYCRRRPATLNDHVSSAALTLDHTDPHTPGAVVPACKGCNASKKDRSSDEADMRLQFCPPVPARDWDDALANGDAAFAAADAAAVPVLMPGHGMPRAAAPTPRPRTQADPYMRSRVPDPRPDPDRWLAPGSGPGPDPGHDPGRTRHGPEYDPGPGPGPESARKPAPDPARDPVTVAVAEPVPLARGREGQGHPAHPIRVVPDDVKLSITQIKVYNAVTYELTACLHIAQRAEVRVEQCESALRFLGARGLVVSVKGKAPVPLRWAMPVPIDDYDKGGPPDEARVPHSQGA